MVCVVSLVLKVYLIYGISVVIFEVLIVDLY